MASDYSILRKGINSISDFQKLQEEFDLRKAQAAQAKQLGDLQMKKIEKELNATDLEGLAQQSLYAYHQGQPLTPEGRAAIETLATLKGSSVKYQPDASGNVRAVSEPNPFQQFLGQFGGQRMPQMSQPPQLSSMENYGNNFSVEPLDVASIEAQLGDVGNMGGQMMGSSPGLNLPVKGGQPPSQLSTMAFDKNYSPEKILNMQTKDYRNLMLGVPDAGANTRQLAQESAVKLEAEKQRLSYEDQIKNANEEIKSGQANAKVATVLNRMNEINEALKQKGAIVSSDSNYGQRLAATAATTDLGQGIRKFNDPQAQALAEEYRNLQATLLPYYANAAGLGAKSLDSEGERKSILQSFGDPAGIYDANKQQIGTLSKLFGVGLPPPLATGNNIPKDIQDILNKYPSTQK